MNQQIFSEKIKSMMPDLINGVIKDCNHLFFSGAIDTEKYDDNYLLPKIILTVALENQKFQYAPLSDMGKKEVKNLMHI